jgi:3-phenylpropionate/cinnamic acid dioxygenase small subunit
MDPERATVELQLEIEQFYYAEAALLDERRIEEWMALLAPEVRYRVPLRSTRSWRDVAPAHGEEGSSVDRELSGPRDSAWFDETRADLLERLRKLRSGASWAEDPPSRTRRLVSNVRVVGRPAPDRLAVRSAFLLYRSRADTRVDLLAGERRDLLRRVGPAAVAAPSPSARAAAGLGGFLVAERVVVLDQSVVLAGHLGLFF